MSAAAIQAFIAAGGAAIFVAVINAVVARRKLGAEATKIITDAASGVVSRVEKDNERLRDSDARKSREIADLEVRVDDLEAEQRAWEMEREDWLNVLQLHAAWDVMALAKLRENDPPLNLPDPPPLTPPVRHRRGRRSFQEPMA